MRVPRPSEVRAAWDARPPSYSPRLWALCLALNGLPWPWGEDLFACGLLIDALIRRKRFRQARAWAADQGRRGAWRTAWSLCATHGRILARAALIGIHNAARLRALVEVRGAAHLAAGRGHLLLSFHLGPRNAYLPLRAAGHRVTWLGGPGMTPAWSSEIRDLHQPPRESLRLPRDRAGTVDSLYRAFRVLRAGGDVVMSADGYGAETFTVPLPGGPLVVREGWLALRWATDVPVLPVLSHLQGRTHVVTIHPALPSRAADPELDRTACRRALAGVLADYVRRFPDQCWSLAFREPPTRE